MRLNIFWYFWRIFWWLKYKIWIVFYKLFKKILIHQQNKIQILQKLNTNSLTTIDKNILKMFKKNTIKIHTQSTAHTISAGIYSHLLFLFLFYRWRHQTCVINFEFFCSNFSLKFYKNMLVIFYDSVAVGNFCLPFTFLHFLKIIFFKFI